MGIEKETKRIEELLIKSGIRPSPARILVLKELMNVTHPLSALELENRLETLDRSSITRSLPLLTEAHLIHQFSDGSGSMKYEICHDDSEAASHRDQHPHFHCRVCGETTCFHDFELLSPCLPEGFKAENMTFIITGICDKCNTKK